MQALFYTKHGASDVLCFGEQPEPTLGAGDVLIKTQAAAVNRLDIVQRNGWFNLTGFSLPHIAGMDMAGVVVAVGDEVKSAKAGDRVVVDP